MRFTLEAINQLPRPKKPRLPQPGEREPKPRRPAVPSDLVALPDLPGDDERMLAAIRTEARWLHRHRQMPHWMDIEDLVHAGWLGYRRGLVVADPGRPVEAYARSYARGAMKMEIRRFYGTGKRSGFMLAALSDNIMRKRGHLRPDWGAFSAGGAEYGSLLAETEPERQEREDRADSGCRAILRGLPRDQRRAVYLRFIRSLRYREIGAEMELTDKQARDCVLRGIGTLRAALGGSEVPDFQKSTWGLPRKRARKPR